MKLKILHISDLHYSKKLSENKVIEAFFHDISTLKVDFVFFTGDMTFAGTKDDFILFTNEFYSRLVELMPSDRVIFCPGNHDVDRSLIMTFMGKTTADNIDSKDSLRKVISGHRNHWMYTTNRLKNYYNFLGKISGSYKRKDDIEKYTYNSFYTNFVYKLNGFRIGITSLNSAWLSEGGQKDYGMLAIGEQNVDAAYGEIKDCDLKLCLFHHPEQWISRHDESINSITKKYDYAFNGHNHDAKPQMISTPYNDLIVSNTGCLYGSDEYFNGYTILEIDKERIKVNVRTYFPKREEFDSAVDIMENGSWEIQKRHLPKLNAEKRHFSQFQNQALDCLVAIDDDRSFIEKFVFPKVSVGAYLENSGLGSFSKDKVLGEGDLFPLESRVLVRGKNESGKTSFLYYLGWKTYIEEDIVPFYIDLEEFVSKGRTPFFREIRNMANDSDINDVELILDEGRCLLLLDNFKSKDQKLLSKLHDFLEKYRHVKIVIASSQSTLDAFKPSVNSAEFKGFKSLYLNSFEAGNIRDLIKVVKPDVGKEEANVLLDSICSLLSRTGLPYNPTMISILLDIQSQIGPFVPINKASLLEKLVEILLKKHDISNVSRGSFDYENQLDLLANFANALFLKESRFTIQKFEAFINLYLTEIGIEDITSYTLIDSFISCNILVVSGDKIEFKIKAFEHFFFAKFLQLYPDKQASIIQGKNYLNFADSIDYLTGLDRKNKTLLDSLLKDLVVLKSEVGFEYDISNFDDSDFGEGVLSDLMDEEVLEKMRINEMPDEQKDELIQMRYPESVNSNVEDNESVPEEKFLTCLELTCNVIRNSELIKDIEYREEAVLKVIKSWATMLVDTVLSMKNDQDFLHEIDINDKESFRALINVVLPIAMQNSIMEVIGSSKLKTVLRNVLDKNEMSKIERLLIILVLEEIDDSTSFKRLKQYLSENKSSYYLNEIIYTFLIMLYEMKPISETKKDRCLDIMSTIVSKRQSDGRKDVEDMVKRDFVNRMKRGKK